MSDQIVPGEERPVISQRPSWRSRAPIPETLTAGRAYVSPGPRRNAPRAEWIEFYRWCQEVFQAIAQTDTRHMNEALAEVYIARDWEGRLTDSGTRIDPSSYYKP
ncbi:AMED_5909 family protein [Actinokineospora globicatena]|uniref:AMED_5909 family protein n=1 Tax=Actinokineospora globicatena TaxID=103729 RepID=UPI0020A36BC4|nr:AMED_5909 family protein [Actinokineospora globicatena]MCP2306105.1 hypothetical protein [Actinokineospora globicatena]GLW80021.1 hypothetical protein Aglo01_45020 [Actinokineospora globicatena]GLW86850.1 hypothetical protein Aglo02_44890 [Actinokineospora globicatena]